MDHLTDVAIVTMAVPTYQPEVVLQHLKWDHGCISHTTEAAFLGTYEKYTQRKEIGLCLLNRDNQDTMQASIKERGHLWTYRSDIRARSIRVTLIPVNSFLNS